MGMGARGKGRFNVVSLHSRRSSARWWPRASLPAASHRPVLRMQHARMASQRAFQLTSTIHRHETTAWVQVSIYLHILPCLTLLFHGPSYPLYMQLLSGRAINRY